MLPARAGFGADPWVCVQRQMIQQRSILGIQTERGKTDVRTSTRDFKNGRKCDDGREAALE